MKDSIVIQLENVTLRVRDTFLLPNTDWQICKGQHWAVLGPNGSGKSTLAHVLSGREEYEVTEGEIIYNNKELLELDPEERAREGLFLAFQYPVELPGVNNTYFLKAALNANLHPIVCVGETWEQR